jgi:hypothetical protein
MRRIPRSWDRSEEEDDVLIRPDPPGPSSANLRAVRERVRHPDIFEDIHTNPSTSRVHGDRVPVRRYVEVERHASRRISHLLLPGLVGIGPPSELSSATAIPWNVLFVMTHCHMDETGPCTILTHLFLTTGYYATMVPSFPVTCILQQGTKRRDHIMSMYYPS